jgi:hypothetical protein
MNSRERVNLALQHQEADRVPLDLGATTVSGMHVSTVYLLRQALALDAPGTPVKVIEPLQMRSPQTLYRDGQSDCSEPRHVQPR